MKTALGTRRFKRAVSAKGVLIGNRLSRHHFACVE
jgi:hypothetical protein